ncbi:hypothetical protein T01_9984 [Trichinella spiralis]|uniref:Uncharacterized protein n=1 Tax=Trichinella spiralis TaxID=6334 RepID=A0A0V1APL2_TRISP|nr:hypothetical protein T01_9984 [Trichinella spiralis]
MCSILCQWNYISVNLQCRRCNLYLTYQFIYIHKLLFRTERHRPRRRDPTRADGAQRSRTEEDQYPRTVGQIVISALAAPVRGRKDPCADVDG